MHETRTDTGNERGRPCPACGAAMEHRHCEYVCPRHGVVYDCSDTFW
ncbi:MULTISPECIES: HVO_2523 family zinc finger protein [Halococcus]|nr:MULTISPECIES: HVO_2523 family zinc finger protein [Halococcus]